MICTYCGEPIFKDGDTYFHKTLSCLCRDAKHYASPGVTDEQFQQYREQLKRKYA